MEVTPEQNEIILASKNKIETIESLNLNYKPLQKNISRASLKSINANKYYTTLAQQENLGKWGMSKHTINALILAQQGDLGKWEMSKHTINANSTMNYYKPNGSRYNIFHDDVITIFCGISGFGFVKGSLTFGILGDNGFDMSLTEDDSKFQISFVVGEGKGDCDFDVYITNNEEKDITIKYGYIEITD